MKLVAIFLCVCVASSLGSVIPLGAGAASNAAVGVSKIDVGAVQVGDQSKDAKHSLAAKQDWLNNDVKKSRVAQNWQQTDRKAAHDANARAQDYNQEASNWDEQRDASNKASAKSEAAVADKAGHQSWSGSNKFDKNPELGRQEWMEKGQQISRVDSQQVVCASERHEGISYSFDKKFDRNANENGGFDAGSKLADHALDDYADRRSSYDRRQNDHAASAANRDRQSADRNAANANAAWANRAAWDKFGRDSNQAAAANANDRDWAEKRDDTVGHNNYNEDQKVSAYDALNDQALLDKNANRNTLGYGAARNAKGVYGKELGYGAPYGYGYAGKGVGVVGKGLDRASGAADQSNVWDAAKRNKNQVWTGDNWVDRTKSNALANQWQQDQVQGFNKDQLASLHDNGYASDANNRDEGAQAANNQWAGADAAKAAQQARADLDEEAHLRANNKWRQSDRDHKFDEWKKFYNNDQKGGQNWERLKYNRDQTDDAAAADFNVARDDASRWQDGHRADSQSEQARGAEAARARDARDRKWSQDWAKDARGAQQQAAQATDSNSKGVWGASDDARKYAVEQEYRDVQDKDAQAWQQGQQRAGFDKMGYGGAKNVYGGARAAYPGYNYGYGYPSNYGYAGVGNYGYGYPNNAFGYGKDYYY